MQTSAEHRFSAASFAATKHCMYPRVLQSSSQTCMQMRQTMVSLVLSTDMSQHFALLAVWQERISAEPDIWAWTDKTMVLVMMLRLADLVNAARATPVAMRWGTLIVHELMEQVRSPLRDRAPRCKPACVQALHDLRRPSSPRCQVQDVL